MTRALEADLGPIELLIGQEALAVMGNEAGLQLLVDVGHGVGIVDLIGLGREIGAILGREVDIVPAANLKVGIASQALDEAIPL